jgi:hypothetical protein
VFIRFYQKDERKESDMAGNVARRKYMGSVTKLQFEMQMEKTYLESRRINWRTLLKWFLKRHNMRSWFRLNLLRKLNISKHEVEGLYAVNGAEFLHKLRDY